jgi:hypothetical protein
MRYFQNESRTKHVGTKEKCREGWMEKPTLQLKEISISCMMFPTELEVKRGGTAGQRDKACGWHTFKTNTIAGGKAHVPNQMTI